MRGVGGRERKNMRSYKRGCLVVRRRKGKVKGEGGKRVCCRYDIEREGKRIEEGRKSSEMRVRVRTTERPTCWSFWLIKVVCYPLIRSIASNIHGKYPTVSNIDGEGLHHSVEDDGLISKGVLCDRQSQWKYDKGVVVGVVGGLVKGGRRVG